MNFDLGSMELLVDSFNVASDGVLPSDLQKRVALQYEESVRKSDDSPAAAAGKIMAVDNSPSTGSGQAIELTPLQISVPADIDPQTAGFHHWR